MATASIRSVRGGSDRGDGSESRGPLWWASLAAAIAIALLFLAWLLGWFRLTTDPRVIEIRRLQQEAREKFVATGGPTNVAEATEAVAAMTQIRQKIEDLPEPLRKEVERSGSSVFRSAMRARIDAYFAAPPEKRLAELDRQIKQEEMMRQAFRAAGAVAGFFGGGGGGGGGGNQQTAAQGSPPGGGPPGGTDEARNAWRKRIIDSTTPEQRARYSEYRRAMDVRRSQLGLPAGGPR